MIRSTQRVCFTCAATDSYTVHTLMLAEHYVPDSEDSKDSTIVIITIIIISPPTGPLRHAQFSPGRTRILRLYGTSSVSMSGDNSPFLSRTGSLRTSFDLPRWAVSYSRVDSSLHRSYFTPFLPFPRVSGCPPVPGEKPSSYLGFSSANEQDEE